MWRSPTFRYAAPLLCATALAGIALGVVAPVRLDGPHPPALLELTRTALAVCASVAVLVGPGLALRCLRPRGGGSVGYLYLPGLGLLVIVGLLSWALASRTSAHAVAALSLGGILVAVLAVTLLRDVRAVLNGSETRLLAIFAVALLLAVGRSLWSLGPVGELYSGTVSRTLEVGDRPDSRIPYHVAQLVAHGTAPYTAAGRSNFLPWSFADRGPLAGIAAAPLMLISGPGVPTDLPNQPWTPFDPQGFAAYRIAMEAMALTALLAVYGLMAAATRREAAAEFAALLVALTPFVVHEAYFTWPKLLAAGLTVLAAQLILERRPGRAGLVVGAAYLAHPLALLSVPSLGLFHVLLRWPGGWGRRLPEIASGAILFGGGLGLWLVAWRLVNGPEYVQSNFLHFFVIVDGRLPSSAQDWLIGRLQSLANTLVPLYLFVRFSGDPSVNSISGPSPRVVHFFFQYWNALPFGVGIAFFPLLVAHVARAARRLPWLVLATVALPILLFTVYWGAAITGMLREGLHAEVLVLLMLVVWVQFCDPPNWAWSARVRLVIASRAPETLLVLMLPTVVTRRALFDPSFAVTDGAAVLLMVGGLAWLGRTMWSLPVWQLPSAASEPDIPAPGAAPVASPAGPL